jgi:hypothetical protein
MVDRLVHALSGKGQGGENGLGCISEVLQLLEGEEILEIGVGKELVKFFLSFAGSY